MVDYYETWKNDYLLSLPDKAELWNLSENFDPKTANAAEKQQYQGLVADAYQDFVASAKGNPGYFFRYICNTVRFVVEAPVFAGKADRKEQVEKYLNLLQAQLSNEELALIFYNALSAYGKNKDGFLKFRELLDDTGFLENIDRAFLLAPNHYVFYPKTKFKFLNCNELRGAQS